MTLPPAAPQRQLKHRRQIDVQVYARGNGLWEFDALRSDGEVVHQFYPRWHRPAAVVSLTD